MKICILVSNNFRVDPRVQKQAKSASNAGYETLVVGFDTLGNFAEPIVESEKNLRIIIGSKLSVFKVPLFLLNLNLLRLNLKNIIANYFYKHQSFTNQGKNIFNWLKKEFLFRNIASTAPTKKIDSELAQEDSKTTNKLNIPVNKSNLPKESVQPFVWIKIFRDLKNNREYYNSLYSHYVNLNKFLLKEGAKFKPDIIHANDLDTLWAGYLIKKKTGAKLIYDAHEIWTEQGIHWPPLFTWVAKKSEKFLLKKIDYFIAVNRSIINATSDLYHHRFYVPTEVVYNCPYFQKTKSPFLDRERQIKVLYHGKLFLNRGLEQLVESTKWLKKSDLYIRGDGDPEIIKKLHEIQKKLKVNFIHFLPPVSMADTIVKASAADVGIIPYIPNNINNKLCTPNKLFEYIMAGLALACSDVPELRKIIKKYKNGILFDPKDPHKIANALNYLSANPSRIEKMKANSLKAAQDLNWEKEEKKLLKVYSFLIQER